MQKYSYKCSHCRYSIQTKGPFPFYIKNGKRVQVDTFHEATTHPITGLMADIYCAECDKEKRYIIRKYKKPVSNILDIWSGNIAGTEKRFCYKCKKPIYLILPDNKIKCPRCRKGTFSINTYDRDTEEDFLNHIPVSAPKGPLKIIQNKKSIKVPKPTVIIDSSERMGYTFCRFSNWFAGTVKKRLKHGDYSIQGMEEQISIERKTLPDLVGSIIFKRKQFIKNMEQFSNLKKKCVVIEASFSEVKSLYSESNAHPNAVVGSLIAIQEKWDIPFYFLDSFELSEEFVASMLSKYHALWWLQKNGFGKYFIQGDI
ncbi:MAG: hypothetical protein JRJ38_10420 [Deltaproteobacteria bacterium]|nr:hypothetical protein [Deltaproteobacteria bacterium]